MTLNVLNRSSLCHTNLTRKCAWASNTCAGSLDFSATTVFTEKCGF